MIRKNGERKGKTVKRTTNVMTKHEFKKRGSMFDVTAPRGTVVTSHTRGWSVDWSRVLKGPYSVQTSPCKPQFLNKYDTSYWCASCF